MDHTSQPRVSNTEEGAKGKPKDESSQILEQLKRGLHTVKVSKFDATEVQRKLEGELFEKWHEKCETIKVLDIPDEKLDDFLDHMKFVNGMDDDTIRRAKAIKFSRRGLEIKIVEWKFNKDEKVDKSGARYGMMALCRSADQKAVDCMYVIYSMDFKIAPKEIVTEKTHKYFWGLFSYTTQDVKKVERSLGVKSIKSLQNFFRMKALQGFYSEGLIDSINYVPSIEDIPDSADKQS